MYITKEYDPSLFTNLEKIGEGAYGTVFKAYMPLTQVTVVLKFIKKDPQYKEISFRRSWCIEPFKVTLPKCALLC
jgi:serine/threonine protein kinase